jgi:DNA polymerase
LSGLVRSVRQYLEVERSFGISELSKFQDPRSQDRPAGKKEALEALRKKFADCALCDLSRTRTKLVFGSGNPEARLMFVGEAPGFDEDQQGEPFVGAAGQLLTKIIEAMKLRREDVYIANCLKCRPPGNRNPLPSEILTCDPILKAQIDIIRPEVICALGKFAAQTLLATEEPISRLRGRFHERQGLKIMPTFHPAYLLRNPADKKLAWEDVQKIMRELGIG